MALPVNKTLRSKGRILDLSGPVVMGILNATPNSFYNMGEGSNVDDLLRNAETMLHSGASILDVGGASTKPGEPLIDPGVELRRILPVISGVKGRFPDAWLSIDTYNTTTAREAVAAGADIVNDVSGAKFTTDMLKVVAGLQVPYIAMHMQGSPVTMQQNPQYDDVVTEVFEYLAGLVGDCTKAGIQDIIIDPGFGFGKTTEHNFQLLRNLNIFRALGRPVLAGISRKSMVCKPLGVNPANALNGTTALHVIALQQEANILRVHDVKEAMQVISLMKWVNQ
ncbi:MAG: dihydropteroate synthase [Taibaiella sp.]|nr:dihydropteroate synthase [Taibaiella sp.]